MQQQFARTIGLISVFAGALLLAFPETSGRLIQARAEFAKLSPNALRLLGSWYFLTGVLLVSVTRPAGVEVEVRAGEVVSPELRRAA